MYLTREEQEPATPRELDARWSEVDAWRIAQSALTRDLVKLRRRVAAGADGEEVALAVEAHETALELAGEKLATANLAYYEARDALEHQPRLEHGHSH